VNECFTILGRSQRSTCPHRLCLVLTTLSPILTAFACLHRSCSPPILTAFCICHVVVVPGVGVHDSCVRYRHRVVSSSLGDIVIVGRTVVIGPHHRHHGQWSLAVVALFFTQTLGNGVVCGMECVGRWRKRTTKNVVARALWRISSPDWSRPYPLERGGADAMGLAFPSEFRCLNLSPHPSSEERGSLPGYSVRLRAKWVARAKGGGSEIGGGRTKLNRDGVDVSFTPRSPS
jgi:hypothetical protein